MPKINLRALPKRTRKRLKERALTGGGLKNLLSRFRNAPMSEWGKIARSHKRAFKEVD